MKKRSDLFWFILILILIVVLLYLFTYYFNTGDKRVIYEGQGKRIYLTKKIKYKNGRIMYNLVLEEKSTGERYFILANTKEKFPEKMLADRILNTYNKGRMKSYDAVESVGITIKKVSSDIHSNLVGTKKPGDVLNELKNNLETITKN